jgi:hypothetical protein
MSESEESILTAEQTMAVKWNLRRKGFAVTGYLIQQNRLPLPSSEDTLKAIEEVLRYERKSESIRSSDNRSERRT